MNRKNNINFRIISSCILLVFAGCFLALSLFAKETNMILDVFLAVLVCFGLFTLLKALKEKSEKNTKKKRK